LGKKRRTIEGRAPKKKGNPEEGRPLPTRKKEDERLSRIGVFLLKEEKRKVQNRICKGRKGKEGQICSAGRAVSSPQKRKKEEKNPTSKKGAKTPESLRKEKRKGDRPPFKKRISWLRIFNQKKKRARTS